MYFLILILLKRTRVPINDIVSFYSTWIRRVLEYCAPVFHRALPACLSDELEGVQKRALSIISSNDMSYHERLPLCNLETLKDRRIELCNTFLDSIGVVHLSLSWLSLRHGSACKSWLSLRHGSG